VLEVQDDGSLQILNESFGEDKRAELEAAVAACPTEALHHLPDELYTSTGQLVELFRGGSPTRVPAGHNARLDSVVTSNQATPHLYRRMLTR
jgi:hypothetical protein